MPPKMSTYDGKNDWCPYYVQSNQIADRHSWTNQQRLDKLIECSRSKTVQLDYQSICKKMDERFGKKDLPNIIRRQLQDLRQFPEESLEAHELSTDGYPGTPDSFIQIVATVRCIFERLFTQEGSFDSNG
jgi:hypothetical protein